MKKLKQLFAICTAPRKVHGTRDFEPDQALRLNFRNAPLQMVLDSIAKALGLIIEIKPNVAVNDKVDVWSNQPLSNTEALNLLEQVLHRHDCTLIQNGRRLVIMRTGDAKKTYIPIRPTMNYQGTFKVRGPAPSRGLFTPAASIWSN
ncbi:MAG TPA: hypothetical protein VFC07_13990 [Verrucomicrobiae bacterium]|nr:hypothetical protein [Verrucomicrobiae bacterium]